MIARRTLRLPKLPPLLLAGLAVWTLVNLLQAGLTELNPDEAYYWMYSRQLAWGYFDHPPVIALMIRMGTLLFDGELGVRLFTVIMGTAMLGLLWVLVGRPRQTERLALFLALAFATPFFNVYGFVATPDGPLLFFSLVFLLLFRRVLRRDGWLDWLALGASMAAMLYSKYHGVLVIGLAVLSQPRIWLNPRFYVASLWGALLFVPHLLWQFESGFPTFRYHLMERNNPPQLKHLLTYLINQPLVFNPFLFPLLVAALIRVGRRYTHPSRPLERTWVALVVGFWLFFLLTVLRGHVEPHWVAVLSIPFLVMSFRESAGRPANARWLFRLALISLLPLLVLRVAILKGVLEDRLRLFHERGWVYPLAEELGEVPVLFNDRHLYPGFYSFYTGNPSGMIYTTGNIRASQFNLWDWKGYALGKEVVVVMDTLLRCQDCPLLDLGDYSLEAFRVKSFPVVPRITVDAWDPETTWSPGSRQSLTLVLSNPYPDSAYWAPASPLLQPVALFLEQGEEAGEEAAGEEADRWPAGSRRSERSAWGDWRFVPLPLGRQALGPGQQVRVDIEWQVPDDWAGSGRFGLDFMLGPLDPFIPEDLYPLQVRPSGLE